jgi:hypothetical protein
MISTGNEKRTKSCKDVGGEKKRSGHEWEAMHNKAFGVVGAHNAVSTKAEADCVISSSNPAGAALLEELSAAFGGGESMGRVSLKSGKNLQFTLGVVPELESAADKTAVLRSPEFWNKYLAKSKSNIPCDFLCYYDKSLNSLKYFNMPDVVGFIAEKGTWRFLDSGRIKGDFADGSKKGFRQYLTYEYRKTHKSYLLGANCDKGQLFVDLLVANLPCVTRQL